MSMSFNIYVCYIHTNCVSIVLLQGSHSIIPYTLYFHWQFKQPRNGGYMCIWNRYRNNNDYDDKKKQQLTKPYS